MQIERKTLEQDKGAVPAVLVHPPQPRGGVVVVHGYGGNKEEQLGLAWRIAEQGFAACAIDLRGHGENRAPMDRGILDDIAAAVSFCRSFGRVAVVGHSLGGRLALLSGADYAIAISPPLARSHGEQTKQKLKFMRGYRVREPKEDVFSILTWLPEWQGGGERPSLILCGSRDVAEIRHSTERLRAKGVPVVEIHDAMHPDIFLLEETFAVVGRQLRQWFGEPAKEK